MLHREIAVSLYERGDSRPTDVAGALDITRGTFEWHLETLLECDLVDKRRAKRRVVPELLGPRNRSPCSPSSNLTRPTDSEP